MKRKRKNSNASNAIIKKHIPPFTFTHTRDIANTIDLYHAPYKLNHFIYCSDFVECVDSLQTPLHPTLTNSRKIAKKVFQTAN